MNGRLSDDSGSGNIERQRQLVDSVGFPDAPAFHPVDYQHVIVPTGFTEDKWIQAAEVRPTDRMVVHHMIAYVREPGSNWFRGQKPDEEIARKGAGVGQFRRQS